MKFKVPTKISRAYYGTTRWARRNSPYICTGLGLVGLGVSAYMLYQARPKIEEGVEELERAKAGEEGASTVNGIKTIAKAVSGPVLGATASSLLILNGQRILSQRLAATTLAYNTLSSKVDRYKEWLKENHPEMATQITQELDRVPESKEEAGKKKSVVVDAVKKPSLVSEAGFFVEASPLLMEYCENGEFDYGILESVVTRIKNSGNPYVTDRDHIHMTEGLYAAENKHGYLRLSEVFEAFGIPKESLKSHPDAAPVDYRRARDMIWSAGSAAGSFDCDVELVPITVEEDGVVFKKDRFFVSFARAPHYDYYGTNG